MGNSTQLNSDTQGSPLRSTNKSFVKANTSAGGDGLFCDSIVEGAKMKKPPFNTSTFRKSQHAGKEGFITYNPGPGSYNTKVWGIRSNFVSKDSYFSNVIQKPDEQGVYFTR